ncbi:MAG TPA: aspartate aminotransferase family protein [Solirubrobacterales bacterium]|nr:aspartate aminotransferase family protein [Solirubrobacterales bacterium]
MSAAETAAIDRGRLAALIARERKAFAAGHERSRELFERAGRNLLGGVPMSWMARWPGGHPVFAAEARGAEIVDVDGNRYVDLCLGDTGAMAGHGPVATAEAVAARYRSGATMMLPTEDAIWSAGELERRFGLPLWQLTLSATDANRFAIRMARQITGRNRILVFSYCYHGTVDESFIVIGPDGLPVSRDGNVGPPVDPRITTEVVEFNDTAALERALGRRDVACVLAEPALTNIGIVLPDPGFHRRLRELTRETGTLLVIDETHTFSAGPGGCTAAWELGPDMLTIGKSIAGGVPAGAFGMSADVAARIEHQENADYEDTGGVGGTLAGNALSTAAIRATLGSVLTDEAFARMIGLADRFTEQVTGTIAQHRLPWHVTQLGARAEYRFSPQPAHSGGESARAGDDEVEEYLHLYLLNRGVLITPFHNMALMSPATTEAEVDLHGERFADACAELRA